ncbi:MAG: LytTR family DNA-binding domain-containing protein [Bacteroidia bacterium]|nr:LytTR family DNA-binding domain-containing protein [Bacteroidia bacterium]
MIRSIAVDDEPFALDVIAIHAAKVPELELVGRFTDPFKALEFLKNNLVDLVFLDINMPGLSGMELISRLKCPPRIIFTTAYSEYALDSYDYEAVDYLLKPIEFDRFYKSIQRYQKQIAAVAAPPPIPAKHIFVKDGYKQVKLLIDDISHIQSDGNYLSIFAGARRTLTRMTIGQITELLPAAGFLRVHNSYLVNIGHIEKIENNHVYCNGVAIPIGAKYREEFFRSIGADFQ